VVGHKTGELLERRLAPPALRGQNRLAEPVERQAMLGSQIVCNLDNSLYDSDQYRTTG